MTRNIGSGAKRIEWLLGAAATAEERFVIDVLAEVTKARKAFPNQDSVITGLALGEEAGETQRALLHIWEGKGGEADLYGEAVQTAAMALRVALEKTDRVTWAGNVASRRAADEARREP